MSKYRILSGSVF